MRQAAKGGRQRPPLTFQKRIMAIAVGLLAAVVCGLGVIGPTAAHGQGARFPRLRRAIVRQRALGRQQARASQDPAALELLRRKIRPSQEYVGEQVTELQNGWTS